MAKFRDPITGEDVEHEFCFGKRRKEPMTATEVLNNRLGMAGAQWAHLRSHKPVVFDYAAYLALVGRVVNPAR